MDIRFSGPAVDFEVIVPGGRIVHVDNVSAAYVHDATGTLHFHRTGEGTVRVFARGAWLEVAPR
jgi:tagatose-1,6-bisphosphate aldolase non-catalytic subunit AgaZ/GatZ